MEHKMLWGALAVGGAGWVCLLALSLSRRKVRGDVHFPRAMNSRVFEWLALALPLLVWLATLPTKAPFSGGQGWGRGFLLGGLVAFIGSLIALRVAKLGTHTARLAATTSLFGAVVVACVPLLWMRRAVIEALLGAASGWVAVALLLSCALTLQNESSIGSESDHFQARSQGRAASVALLNGAAWATALFGVCALGVYRDFVVADVARGTHPAIAVTLAASVALALLFPPLLPAVASSQGTDSPSLARSGAGASSSSLAREVQVVSILASIIVPLGIGFLMATRVLDDFRVFECIGVGSILGLLGWALGENSSRSTDEVRSTEQPRSTDEVRTSDTVATLLALCSFMFAYGLEQGFGVGLMLLAAWPVSLLVLPASETNENEAARLRVAQTLSILAAFLAVLLVSRAFATRFRADLRGANLSDQFALFGFVAGALLPSLLASLSLGLGLAKVRSMASASPARLVGAGVLALLILGATLALWGIKVVPACFAGLALGLVLAPRLLAPLCALFSLSLCLVLTQWTGRFLPLAEASRAQRMHFLLWGLGMAVLLVLLVDIGARLLARLGNRGGVPAQTQEVSS